MLDPDRCVATITRGKNKWHRCSKPGIYYWGTFHLGDTRVKLCPAHYGLRGQQLDFIVQRYFRMRYGDD